MIINLRRSGFNRGPKSVLDLPSDFEKALRGRGYIVHVISSDPLLKVQPLFKSSVNERAILGTVILVDSDIDGMPEKIMRVLTGAQVLEDIPRLLLTDGPWTIPTHYRQVWSGLLCACYESALEVNYGI